MNWHCQNGYWYNLDNIVSVWYRVGDNLDDKTRAYPIVALDINGRELDWGYAKSEDAAIKYIEKLTETQPRDAAPQRSKNTSDKNVGSENKEVTK